MDNVGQIDLHDILKVFPVGLLTSDLTGLTFI